MDVDPITEWGSRPIGANLFSRSNSVLPGKAIICFPSSIK